MEPLNTDQEAQQRLVEQATVNRMDPNIIKALAEVLGFDGLDQVSDFSARS